MLTPDLTQFKALAADYNLIPVWREVPVDFDTPVSLFAKLSDGGPAFLLESLEGGEKWGRYSFIGLRPFLVFGCRGREVFTEVRGRRETRAADDPLEVLREIMGGFRPAPVPGLPRFYGGAVGYLGYDMVRFMERLPELAPETTGFADATFMFPELLLVHDNLRHSLQIVACLRVDDPAGAEGVYQQGVRAVENITQRLRRGIDYRDPPVGQQVLTHLAPEIPRERFEEMVRRAKEYIRAGDVIQVVLSQRFSGQAGVPPFDLYRALRKINPSPYLYYLQLGDEVLVGSSPEILVRLTDGLVEVRPIAGTRPRGRTPEEDAALEAELLADPKERAEHLMLVDLGRNDVGRVARIGTVRVNDLMVVERYSHVMHLVSGVTGRLAEGRDMFDVLRACFPAGTVSGAPKIRAMEIIEELEPVRRGPYAGAVGYLGFSGNMDLAITIRTLFQKGDRLYLQAGAGIVADSDPAREWDETLNKGRALMRAIDLAQEGL
ncbi:anthranilate synthase component I [Dissulfurirhabdus thermomarina]|uniref:Anthranilate synthase component 1 n=1 Tax=Dissulfurirhabdus thermomarina TaxID=1765737 RepID=A0A6N9TVK1_DISTH|nr:anthranilate synthase component I [Dissulfurirhabdus thermomarina]NDY42516.1 anthranilate synthase component I [Dissulfurirhabdus thermomarina]NMX24203.1 anthranilate synthase component I [Dissulfurirhabdus thermomarina]